MKQLAYSLNLSLVLCEAGVVPDGLDCVQAAHDALTRANWISRKNGRWTLAEDGYEVMCAALAVHDKQIAVATNAQLVAADRLIHSRIASGDVIHVEPTTAH